MPCGDGGVSGFSDLAAFHRLGPDGVPPVVLALAAEHGDARLVWRNELGGLTFRLGDGPYVKWSPRPAGPALDRERDALGWLAGRHPVPAVLDHGTDEGQQWLLTAPAAREHAVGDRWRPGGRRRSPPSRPGCGRCTPCRWTSSRPTTGPARAGRPHPTRARPLRRWSTRSSCTATPARPTPSSTTRPVGGPRTSTSATSASGTAGPTWPWPRSAWTGTSGRATSPSSHRLRRRTRRGADHLLPDAVGAGELMDPATVARWSPSSSRSGRTAPSRRSSRRATTTARSGSATTSRSGCRPAPGTPTPWRRRPALPLLARHLTVAVPEVVALGRPGAGYPTPGPCGAGCRAPSWPAPPTSTRPGWCRPRPDPAGAAGRAGAGRSPGGCALPRRGLHPGAYDAEVRPPCPGWASTCATAAPRSGRTPWPPPGTGTRCGSTATWRRATCWCPAVGCRRSSTSAPAGRRPACDLVIAWTGLDDTGRAAFREAVGLTTTAPGHAPGVGAVEGADHRAGLPAARPAAAGAHPAPPDRTV